MNIKLADNTITQQELDHTCNWIMNGNRLTKDKVTVQFEHAFMSRLGVKHAVFTNSGSSFNLLMIAALKEGGYLRNSLVIAPAVSWVTTVSPLLQLGFDVKLCDCDKNNLGLDVHHFEQLCQKYKPAMAIMVHVLGHANDITAIQKIADKYDVLLIEDACEALGSKYNDKNLGALTKAGSFSFYYGHHLSTIEGGMVITDDENLYHIMLSMRSHGWSRDLPEHIQNAWLAENEVDSFRNLYTFYYPGFNLRATDLQAYIGLQQLEKLDDIVIKREKNYHYFSELLGNDFYKQTSSATTLSSFAYGTLVNNPLEVYQFLKQAGIESRPLVCGNIARHPFWKYGNDDLPNADIIHDYGIYLPNHYNIGAAEIDTICAKFLEVAEPKHFS